ncbi:sialin-like [Contarinia nasturtii]|uniref:sialin-like n=1 Tax=Contarinia nasturtii TaxID=265458 RepID=UPI0012D46FD0|nr:sialin-like [Contarinia nasturtii]XP_031630276.1 sialin-like [Contarinia nasturtii]XP_031630277.1 sialin-like [Contarinia nasturtii]
MVDSKNVDVENTKSTFPPTRLSIAFMLFATSFVGYVVRVNLSIIIIGMVRTQPIENQTELQNIKYDMPDYGPRYNWTISQQYLLLSAFFYGLMGTQLIGGFLNQLLGPRFVIGACLGLSAIATAFIPLAAELFSFWAVFGVRLFLGALAGILSPGMSFCIAKWSPPQEKGKFVFTMIGGTLGTVVTWPFVAFLMTHFGWVYAFYVPATIVLFTTILWFYVVYNSPYEHPRISEQELKYIEASQGNTVSRVQRGLPPIRCILKSVPFWALFFLQFSHMWSFFFLIIAAPKYLNEVLKFDLTQSGLLASLPYLSRFICGFVFGAISDYMIKHELLTVTQVRKFFSVFSHILPGLLMYGLRFVSDSPINCVIVITVALGLNGASTCVNLANSLDLAPNYAAAVSAIINTFTTATGIIAPMVVTYFTRENNTVNEWNQIFLISATLYVSSAIVFMAFGSGKVQDWNDDTYKIKRDAKRKLRQSNESHF